MSKTISEWDVARHMLWIIFICLELGYERKELRTRNVCSQAALEVRDLRT